MTDTILEAVQIKEKLYKTWQKSRSEDDHTAYKIKRKSVTFAIKSAKDKLEGTYIYSQGNSRGARQFSESHPRAWGLVLQLTLGSTMTRTCDIQS